MKVLSRERQDSVQPCPVCQEEFGLKEQVRRECGEGGRVGGKEGGSEGGRE